MWWDHHSSEIQKYSGVVTSDLQPLILTETNTTLIVSKSPQTGKGTHPLRPDAWQIDGMFIGGHRSGGMGGVEPEGKFFSLNPSVTPPTPALPAL